MTICFGMSPDKWLQRSLAYFGVHSVPLAEDVVQHAFLLAFEAWTLHGVPENPLAWLLATAKHRALEIVRNERTARTFPPELG